ncbi:MAG: aldo/keto reductase [Actinobacteria bacterium]|nr:aldo/keto reductase [Actinomycetota bacterium]
MRLLRSRAVTELALTELSLGCAQLGNLYRSVTDDEAAATVDAAWNAGIRYFDTAPHYGLGLSERRLGGALAGRARSEYVVSTKVGRRLVPLPEPYGRDDDGFDVPATHRRVWDFSRDGVLRSLEESLERLGLDRVDVVFLHDPDDHWAEALNEAYPALEELRAQGAVSSIGAGMNQAAMLADFVRHTDMDLLMLAGRYTLLEQGALDDLLPLCLERDVHVVAAGVFNSGVLARDDPPTDAKYNYADASPAVLDCARRIADVCRSHDVSLPAAAIAFPLLHPAVASVCLGARSPEQVERNADLHHRAIPADLWRDLKSEGLLRDDAPMPH